jgi:hypothetical protein
MFPLMAPEMVSARVEELRREGDAMARRAGAAPGRSAIRRPESDLR